MKKKNKNNKYKFLLFKLLKEQMIILRVVFLHCKKRASDLAVITIIVGMNYLGLSAIGRTLCYFDDIEQSSENFSAGTLDFILNDGGFDPIEPSVSLSPENVAQKNITIVPEASSTDFQYSVGADNFGGDSDFCEILAVKASLEGETKYLGVLKDLKTATTTSLGLWNFEFGTGTNNFQNKICNFDVVYNGWENKLDYPDYESGGFSDTEFASSTISSWGFRINKVYYDVADDRGKEYDNEWVEIYNQSDVPLDINNWKICDNNSCDVLSAEKEIPAQGYGFIVASSTTASTTMPAFWYLPEDVVEVKIPDSRIGNGLGNDGDALYLQRPDGVVIDEVNWQINDDVWNPGAVDVKEGNVLSRKTNGYDTDQASDWVELIPPSVDLVYPDEGGSYTWYWGYNYEIKWTATNNNGEDSELDINLYYIKDESGNGEIGAGDIKIPIAEKIANNGSYVWTVPSGFTGYVWVYLVVTGPENPMLNSGAVSGPIYDPIPIFIGEGEDNHSVNDFVAENAGIGANKEASNDEGEEIKEERFSKVGFVQKKSDEGEASDKKEEEKSLSSEESSKDYSEEIGKDEKKEGKKREGDLNVEEEIFESEKEKEVKKEEQEKTDGEKKEEIAENPAEKNENTSVVGEDKSEDEIKSKKEPLLEIKEPESEPEPEPEPESELEPEQQEEVESEPIILPIET